MSSKSEFAKDFLLDRSVVFLNHGSFGATPRLVFEAYQNWQRQMEAQPVEFLARKAPALLYQARSQLATYLNVDPNDLVFVTNATTGLNIAARSLSLHAGDVILTTNHEYGAMDRTWRFLAREKRFEYRSINIPLPVPDTQSIIESFQSAITPNVKAIFLSHITSPTAVIFPVKEICALARMKGVLSIIDGAHAPGQIPLDIMDIGADIYCGNLHKWLCAPKGSAFLWVRKEIQPLIQPLVVSWGWECENPGPSPFVDYLEWAGTRDISAFLAVSNAIAYQNLNGWNSAQEQCYDLARKAELALCNSLDVKSIYASTDQFAQMFSISLPRGLDPIKVKERLYSVNRIEVPVHSWEDHIILRVSIQVYNRMADVEKLKTALHAIYQGVEHA
jgi:isopenicillin-N epimerase